MPVVTWSKALLMFSLEALAAFALLAAFDPAVSHGISQFRAFDDKGAEASLKGALEAHLSPEDQAVAHIYLGLIALNRFVPAEAKRQFQAALNCDPTAKLPRAASPKARKVFAEVVAAQPAPSVPSVEPAPVPKVLVVEATPVPAPEKQITLTPLVAEPAVAAVPSVAVEAPPPRPWARRYLPSLVLGGVAVAALVAGLALGAASRGSVASARADASVVTAQSDLRNGKNYGIAADVGFGLAAVTAGVGAALLPVEMQ